MRFSIALLPWVCFSAWLGGVDACVCTDATSVPVRSSACGSVVKTHTLGACWQELSGRETCGGTDYWQVDYGNGRSVWVDFQDIMVEDSSKCSGSGGSCDNVEFVTREGWGARPPSSTTPYTPPWSMVFVHHSAGAACSTPADCERQMRLIQDLHMDSNGWADIGYSFLVGEDGRVYEGRGWLNMPAQASGHNSYAYGICIMGTFTSVLPNDAAQQAVKDIIDCGIRQGHVTLGHEEFGHRDGVCTQCPGNMFYPVLQTWPRYSFRDIPVNC